MAKIVFDVETAGRDFESLDETSKEFFLKFAETDQEKEDARNSLSFFPVTAEIITIGMVEVETEKAFVYFQNGNQPHRSVKGDVTYIAGSEKEILHHFWNHLKNYTHFVTFNGRCFDCPFVMLRSAIHGIRGHKNLMPYRYAITPHVDLADQLSFYDALRRKFSLHMWCTAFGIPSPKEEGMTGLQVKDFYKAGRYLDIARYCLGDIYATKKLFQYWDQYLKFESKY